MNTRVADLADTPVRPLGDAPRWLSIKTCADHLGVSVHTILRAVHRGDLAASRPTGPRGRFRIREDLFLRWIERDNGL